MSKPEMSVEEKVLGWFEKFDAVWMHNGDLRKPHAELTSGKCSNGFFDCMYASSLSSYI